MINKSPRRYFLKRSAFITAGYWAADGVHPTYSGHQLMADEWGQECFTILQIRKIHENKSKDPK